MNEFSFFQLNELLTEDEYFNLQQLLRSGKMRNQRLYLKKIQEL